ncbi:hypothetical protein B0H15DRAFT_803837 [Mycena belliarum]|uniref:Uncharacterized protein n=1 Tax=Mycena belliarum TaxID=1033014 RepID=A0AAD6XM67_9AGAR|nr:hypothetical protein B0H15DRAFT_803837 [Mycena belliae]
MDLILARKMSGGYSSDCERGGVGGQRISKLWHIKGKPSYIGVGSSVIQGSPRSNSSNDGAAVQASIKSGAHALRRYREASAIGSLRDSRVDVGISEGQRGVVDEGLGHRCNESSARLHAEAAPCWKTGLVARGDDERAAASRDHHGGGKGRDQAIDRPETHRAGRAVVPRNVPGLLRKAPQASDFLTAEGHGDATIVKCVFFGTFERRWEVEGGRMKRRAGEARLCDDRSPGHLAAQRVAARHAEPE